MIVRHPCYVKGSTFFCNYFASKWGNVGMQYLRLSIHLYMAITGNLSKLLEIVSPNQISLASATPIRPTLLPLRAKKKPPMPWKKPLMSFQGPSIKDVDSSFLIFWHLLPLSIIFFLLKNFNEAWPLPPPNYRRHLWTAPDFSESPAALPLRYLQTLTQISSTLVGMAIWVVKFSSGVADISWTLLVTSRGQKRRVLFLGDISWTFFGWILVAIYQAIN